MEFIAEKLCWLVVQQGCKYVIIAPALTHIPLTADSPNVSAARRHAIAPTLPYKLQH